jgi:parallel beta-helix repeat protein
MKTGRMITALLGTVAITSGVWAQGSLTPPGAPAPTMRSLEEIYTAVTSGGGGASETRTAISTLPFTITESGSYYVVSNLTMTVTGQHGINVTADDVTIDLCGFTLTGPGENSGDGIGSESGYKSTRVFNGTIRNWKGGYAVKSAFNSSVSGVNAIENEAGISAVLIENCQAIKNENSGIYGQLNSVIRNCKATENGYTGIYSGQANTIENCAASYNGQNGMVVGAYSVARGCSAFINTHNGILAETSTQIISCVANGNERHGIEVYSGASVINCTASFNGDRTNHEDGAGIFLNGSGCLAQENTLTDNMWGIYAVSHDSRIGKNVISGMNSQKGLYITGSNNRVFGNEIAGTEDNYDIAAGNQLNLLLCEIPESLDWSCSVKLAGTLTGSAGISVTADDVTIDLNGHALIGPGTGDVYGVWLKGATNNTIQGIVVCNGTVRDFKNGIRAEYAQASRIEHITARSNTSSGIGFYGQYGQCNGNIIRDCTVRENGEKGLELYGPSGQCNGNIINNCLVSDNTGVGIYLIGLNGQCNGNALADCTVSGNSSTGVALHGYSGQCCGNTVVDCTIIANRYDGIGLKGSYGLCEGNTIANCTIRMNENCGISLEDANGNRVEGNHVTGQIGTPNYGIYSSRTENNLIIRNTCIGQTDNFILNPDDTYGPIVTSSGELSEANPWANFSR